MSRTAERKHLDPETRHLLAEKDLDEHEEDIGVLSGRLDKILWALIGILISTSTAAVLLALNLVVNQ